MCSDEIHEEGKGAERRVAIAAQGLSKAYHIYDTPQHRLWQMLWGGRRKFYRDYLAVQNVDLTVYGGETV